MLIYELPKPCLDVIDNYFKLKAAEGKYVRCPYFRNPISGKDRWGLAAYSGKGSPEEIEEELRIIEKLEYKDFSQMKEEDIRDVIKKRKLGVDCSGFITHILDAWTREFYKKPLYKLIKFHRGGITWLLTKLRPYTHIDVETFVHVLNAQELNDTAYLMPGDLIRFNTNIDHAIIVTKVEKNTENKIVKAYYTQSVLENIETREGIKWGVINFVNPGTNDLLKQEWQEFPETGQTINNKGEPKIYRLRILDALKHENTQT